jgi:hypothetical protein
MLNAVKHLYRFSAKPFNEAAEMLRLRYAALRMTTTLIHLPTHSLTQKPPLIPQR